MFPFDDGVNLFDRVSWSLGLLAAGLIFAYGVWVGRRDLGVRAMWGVLGATVLGLLPPLVLAWFPQVNFWYSNWNAQAWGHGALETLVRFVLTRAVALFLSFLPLYVAVNWLEVIRERTRQGP